MDSIPPIAITVRRFQPVEGDQLGKSWVDAEGRLRELELQPYAIADVRQYAAQFATYLRDNYMGWAESEGGPYTIVAALIQSEVCQVQFEQQSIDMNLWLTKSRSQPLIRNCINNFCCSYSQPVRISFIQDI